METVDFNQIVEDRLKRVREVLLAKADEYARGDRLSNFKKIASMTDSTPERALMMLVSKHIVATCDFVADIEKGLVQPYPRWDEKIGDIMAYMVLLDALIQERKPT